MKAYVIHTWGDIDQLKLETVDRPFPGAEELVVQVKAVALNPLDYIVLSGALAPMMTLPAVIGSDVAGVVTAVGSRVKDFTVGDEVMGLVNFPGTDGSLNGRGYAQFAPVPASQVIKKPSGLTFKSAAAMPAVSLTAWQALMSDALAKPGQRVLIHGGAGGVGHIAVQLAKQAGAYVVATARGKDAQFVRALGADKTIDYQTEQFDEMLQDVDLVFDTVGGKVMSRSLTVIKRGGALITTQWPELDAIKQDAASRGITATAVQVHTDTQQLTALAQQVAAGVLQVHIDTVYPFEQLPSALNRLRNGGVQGKLVVTISESPDV